MSEPKAPSKRTATKPEVKQPEVKKPEVKLYVSVRSTLYHPFQRVYVPVEYPGVELEMDSWLDSQILSGLIKEI